MSVSRSRYWIQTYSFVVTLAILILFALVQERTIIVTVKSPSLAEYRQLEAKYSDALNCPCSTVTIPYENFASVEFSLHEICSSIFVSDAWIAALYTPDASHYLPTDFRASGNSQVHKYSGLFFTCTCLR